MKIAVASLITASVLAGCASPPSSDQIATADYGTDMTQEQCVSIAQQKISSILKDPMSAQFQHGKCFKGYGGNMPAFGVKAQFGWVQSGSVNAKNSYGGYIGFRTYEVIIKNGTAIRYCMADKDGFCIPVSLE